MGNPGRFATKKLDTTISARALYGAELRYHRERNDLSLVDCAARLHIEQSFLARVEQGERRLPLELTGTVDRVLEADGFFVRNATAGRSAIGAERITPLPEWEWLATVIKEWDAALVPGLLHTQEYGKAVRAAYAHHLADRGTRQRWEARMSRTPVLHDPTGPRYVVILGETVLRRTFGGARVMAEQLGHVAELARAGRITVHVLPLAALPHLTGDESAVRLMTYPDEPTTAHVAMYPTGAHLTDPATTALAQFTYDLLYAAALPSLASLDLIDQAVAAYGKEAEGERQEHEPAAAAG